MLKRGQSGHSGSIISAASEKGQRDVRRYIRGRLDDIDRQRWWGHLGLWLGAFDFVFGSILRASRMFGGELVRSNYVCSIGGTHGRGRAQLRLDRRFRCRFLGGHRNMIWRRYARVSDVEQSRAVVRTRTRNL